MQKNDEDIKHFNMRVPKHLWLFLKGQAAANEVSMTEIVNACIEKHKKNIEKKLTQKEADV